MQIQRDAATRLNLHLVNLEALAADPVTEQLNDGDIWYNGTTHALKCYINGAVKTITIS